MFVAISWVMAQINFMSCCQMNGLKLRRLPETLSHLEKMGSFPAYDFSGFDAAKMAPQAWIRG
jgi:hypothetical protein